MAFPTFEEWKQQKREAEDRKYRAYEDNFRAYQAGEAVDLSKIEGGFSQADFDGWKQWHEQNKDRLDVEYTVKALDQDLVDAVRGQYQAQWGSKYYYDLFDPEDAARAAGGQMPKYLDGTYDLDNPYDRWLYDNGLPNRADFSDMYSQAAYDRQERWEENTSLLKGIEKDWNTVYDQKEAFQNAYNAALDETAQQSGRAPTQAEREALAQELLMSGKYDDIAAAYSALPDVRQEPDTLEAYVDRLEQPDYSAYDAMLQAMQDGTAVDDAFFDAYRKSDYDKWFSGQIAFTQQQLDDAYEQYLTDKQQKALEAQLRPGQEAASEIDKLLADGKASEAETKITDAIAALDDRLAGFEQANELWERYRRAAIRNASVPTTDAFIPATPAREADLTGAIDDLEAKLQEEPERYGMDAADVATFVSLLRQRTLLQTQGRAAVSTVQAQAQQQERQDAIEREEQRVNDKYAALDEAKDFASKSAQSDEVLAALEDPYQQNMYRAVNRIMDEGYNPIYGNWGVIAKGEPVTLSMWIQVGLTDEERARYNYLVATQGGAAGEQYIKDLKPQLQRRYAEVTDERQRQTAKELPVLSSLASVYMQFPAAVEGAIALAGTLGDEDYVQNNPAMFSGTRFIQNVRESVAEGMSPTGQFFYQTGMSISDNVARLPLGKAGLGVMGGAVLSSTVNDYVAKGYSGGDALMMGVGSAAIEVLTEKISLDNLMRILKGGATRLSRSALQQAVKEAFQQSIYEGSEEMASEILNYFWESAVLDDGEYDQAVARYEAMGLTKNQAVSQALKDKLPDVLLSGAGGFLSGLVMGGGGSLIAEWRSDTAAGDGFGGNAVQQAQAGREIRLAYQEAVKEDGRVLGDEAARQLKDDLQTLGVAKETARTVLQGVDMPNAWASDGLRTAMESVSETARSEAARVEARAARTEAAELKSSQRLGTLMEKFTAAQEKANAARAQNDLKGYLAAVEDMRGAVLNYQNALAVEEKAGEARQIETQEQTRKATAATERAVADAQPAVQEGYARVAAEIATQRAAAQQFGAQQAAGQAQNAAGQAEAGPDQRTVTGQGDTGRGSDAPASTAKGAAQVDVMDELVRGAGTAVSAQETEGTGARARSVMEEVLAGTEEPGARPAGQGRRRYRAGVNRADTAGRLDAADRMQLRVLDGLGKKYGVKIVIEDTIRYEDGEGRVYAGTANAYYDRSDGTIHVALDAEGGAYLFFAVHELTHKLRAENANAYAALEAFVLNKLEASELYGALTQGEGGTLEERIASVRALYAARGLELSRGEALEELVCDAIPVILTDEQTVRELVRTDRTLAERIRDFFEEFYNELMRQLAGVVYGPGNRVEAAALMNDTETVRELAELFKTALESSADLQYELLTQSGSAIEEAENDKKRGRRLSARADGEDAITMEDVAAIQSIGRKSVNAFSSDEIRTAEPFARRYWRELGVKSPFFRAWFGDWRANDRTPVQLVRVAGADAPKSGRAINADTGRPISWGDRLRSETWAHGTKNALESIKGIDRIIETAVLLDTIAANQTGKSKLPGTAFMHSLYSLVDDGSGLTLYRLFAEEAVPVGGGDPFTRAYELKEIKKVATAPYGVLSVSGGLTNGAPATTYTIADLFAFVKENVPDFQPKPVHPAMLNADGTPRAVRQGVDATVEVLDGKTALQDGEAVYVKLENPYPAGTAAEVPGRAALEAGGYDGAVYQDGNGGTHYAVLDGTQLKSATDNAGTFDGRNPNLRFSQKADAEGGSAPGRIYDYSKPFAEQVDDWMAGQTPQYDTLLIGRTPLLYRQIGLSDVPMTIDQTHLDYMVNGTKNEDHHLGVALVKQLPELLEHPVAVIESATRPGDSVMAIVRGKVNGKQLVAAVRIGGNGRINYEIIDSNHIVSAQGRGNAVIKLLNDALQKELRGEVGVYYWNKNEALPLTVQSGVQFPGGRINDGLIHSIFDAASPVNRNYLEQTETQQFKRWFGRSSVVQADGTPRAVRQGVDATVEVLDGKTALQDGEAVYVKLENPYPAGTAAEVPGRAALEAGGYDGAVYQGGDGGTHYAVLDGTQLKSATDNAGTFDGRNPNFRFSEKAAAEERDVAPAVSEKVLGNVAKRILQRTGSGYSAARLTDGLKTLLHTDAEQRRETADALARQVLAESRERDDRMYDRTLEARAYFRRGKFRLNETQKAEMAYRYNSYGNYRKSLMGKLNLVNSGGSYLDSVWGEICELFPEYFSPDTSEGDQPQKLKEFLDMAYARPEVNPYEQFHGMEDAAAALADELVETVENIGRRPAPERYLEDGRDAEAWEAYWSEVKAGAKGRPAVQRPATRSERLRRAWELFDNGMTPVQYWRQSREEARQASELRLFDDGQPAADTFDTKTSNLLRGLMLQNGESVGGALSDDRMSRVMGIFSHARPRVAAALSLSAPVRVFEDVTGWGGGTAAERAQNVKDGNYLKDTYYEYGNLQAANRELWIAEKTRAVLEAVRGHGAYGVLESAVTQMLGEQFVTEEQAGAAVSDGKTMIVEAQEGGVFVLTFGRDGKTRLMYSSDGVTTTTYDEAFRERVRRAAGKRSLRALMPVPKTEAGGLRVERLGGDVSVLTADGKPVARVENGAHPNMPAVRAALGALQRFYADTYDEIAAVRVENGYAPPGHIEHYFPHQSRVYDGVEGFAEAFMENDLPTGINGMTGTFSPGQPWNANLQQRFGTYTEFDAIRGFNRYVCGAADTIFYTPVIQRYRQLEKALRQQGADALTAEDAKRNSAFVDWVHEQANEWAKKKASPDRGLESLLGRGGYSVSGMLTSLVSQSSVGGSLSSAASNLIGGLTGMAQVDFKHALREGMRTTWQLLRRFDKRGGGYDGFAEQIPFLQRRFSENEDILLTRPEQFRRAGSKALYALFSELDRWAVESVARAKYAECLDDGMTKLQAIAATNDLLIKNFADRGKGQAPRIFNVKWARPFVQFQLEVLNQLHHFRDMDRAEVEKKLYELERRYGQGVPWDELEKKALSGGGPRKLKKVMAYLLLISLWGFLARALLGRDQTWNPLGMAVDAVQDFREGGAEQAGAGLLEAVMDNVPFVSVLSGGGRVPLASNLSNVSKAVEALLSGQDFANADLVQAGTSFLPGGGQLRKTIQGAQANAAGGKYTKDGRLQYPIGEEDFWKTLLFGPSAAAPQGYDWTDALTKTETAAYEALVDQGYDPYDLYDTLLGYGGSTNAEKALSLLENRGEWDDGELNMIAELLGLDAGNDLERYAARETERYLSEKRKALAKGQITQQEYDRIEKRLTDQLADVQTGA